MAAADIEVDLLIGPRAAMHDSRSHPCTVHRRVVRDRGVGLGARPPLHTATPLCIETRRRLTKPLETIAAVEAEDHGYTGMQPSGGDVVVERWGEPRGRHDLALL
jgi:hypothetical protein